MTVEWPALRELLLCLLLGSCQTSTKPLPANVEPLDHGHAPSYKVESDDIRIAEQRWLERDDRSIVAVQRRPLTRDQLRAVARHLAGSAKTPNIDLYASEAVHGACVRSRFLVVRGGRDEKDSTTCFDGTVLRMDQSEPRVLHWGAGAPAEPKAR